MPETYAIIKNNKVINVIVWNGDSSIWSPPENCIAINIQGKRAKIGDTYDPVTNTFIE